MADVLLTGGIPEKPARTNESMLLLAVAGVLVSMADVCERAGMAFNGVSSPVLPDRVITLTELQGVLLCVADALDVLGQDAVDAAMLQAEALCAEASTSQVH